MIRNIKKLKPVIHNMRISPYRLDSNDLISIFFKLTNGTELLNLKNVQTNIYLNYPSKWTKVTTSNVDSNSIINLSVLSLPNNVTNCLIYTESIINNKIYNSNIVRLNFINSNILYTGNLIEFENELIEFESGFFTFGE